MTGGGELLRALLTQDSIWRRDRFYTAESAVADYVAGQEITINCQIDADAQFLLTSFHIIQGTNLTNAVALPTLTTTINAMLTIDLPASGIPFFFNPAFPSLVTSNFTSNTENSQYMLVKSAETIRMRITPNIPLTNAAFSITYRGIEYLSRR